MPDEDILERLERIHHETRVLTLVVGRWLSVSLVEASARHLGLL